MQSDHRAKILKRQERFGTEIKLFKHFKKLGEHYKAEIIESIPKGEELSIYFHGDLGMILCRGPHLPSLGQG